MSDFVEQPLAGGRGMRALRRSSLFAMPVLVGLVAASILGVLQNHEQTARQTRLLLAQIHEDALLQQEILVHAQVMGFLTKDLPHSLAVLHASANANIADLRKVAGSEGSAGVVAATWLSYESAQSEITGALPLDSTGSMAATGVRQPNAGRLVREFRGRSDALGRLGHGSESLGPGPSKGCTSRFPGAIQTVRGNGRLPARISG